MTDPEPYPEWHRDWESQRNQLRMEVSKVLHGYPLPVRVSILAELLDHATNRYAESHFQALHDEGEHDG